MMKMPRILYLPAVGLLAAVFGMASRDAANAAQDNPPVVPMGQPGLGQQWIPPQGEWLQVLTVTDKWLVLQNEQGQQFPLSFDAAQLFIMRWPTDLGRIEANDLIETTGIDLGTQRIVADHIDIYKGDARSLVTPALQRLIGNNRVVTLWDAEAQNVLGIRYQYALSPEEWFLPWKWHVVASPVSTDPLMLGIGGNNSMGIVPGQNGMSMTEVTPGVPSFVRPGDVAYLVPQLDQTTPRTLVASQLVIYKSVPIDAMAR